MLDGMEDAQRLCDMHGYRTAVQEDGTPVVLLLKVPRWRAARRAALSCHPCVLCASAARALGMPLALSLPSSRLCCQPAQSVPRFPAVRPCRAHMWTRRRPCPAGAASSSPAWLQPHAGGAAGWLVG